MTGIEETSSLIRAALTALVERESARRLARLGGSDPDATAASPQEVEAGLKGP